MPAGSADSSMEAPRHGEGHAFEAACERAAPACHRLPACRACMQIACSRACGSWTWRLRRCCCCSQRTTEALAVIWLSAVGSRISAVAGLADPRRLAAAVPGGGGARAPCSTLSGGHVCFSLLRRVCSYLNELPCGTNEHCKPLHLKWQPGGNFIFDARGAAPRRPWCQHSEAGRVIFRPNPILLSRLSALIHRQPSPGRRSSSQHEREAAGNGHQG